jgi:hypothetical protein
VRFFDAFDEIRSFVKIFRERLDFSRSLGNFRQRDPDHLRGCARKELTPGLVAKMVQQPSEGGGR